MALSGIAGQDNVNRRALSARFFNSMATSSPLDNLTHKVLARIYRDEGSFSRNKNFESYRDPRVRRAARISKLLKSLEHDLLEHGTPETLSLVEIEDSGSEAQMRIRIQIESLSCKRTAFLTPFEFELLCENAPIRSLFERTAA